MTLDRGAQRIANAKTQLPQLREQMAFEKITVIVSSRRRHWRFYYDGKLLLQYWPSRSRTRIDAQLGAGVGIAEENMEPACRSAAQAGTLAIQQRDLLLAAAQEG